MIVFDTPRAVRFRRFRRGAHLISTERGAAGRRELLDFAARIGLHPEWLQRPGTRLEHFDLFDARIDGARLAGAVEITPKQLARHTLAKRHAGKPHTEAETMDMEMLQALAHTARQELLRNGGMAGTGGVTLEARLFLEMVDAIGRPSGLRPAAPGAEIPWPVDFPEDRREKGDHVLYHRELSAAERQSIAGDGNNPDIADVADAYMVLKCDAAMCGIIEFAKYGSRWLANPAGRGQVALLLAELGDARGDVARLRVEVNSLLAAANTRDADAEARGLIRELSNHLPNIYANPNHPTHKAVNAFLSRPKRQAQRHDPECLGCHTCKPWEFCGGMGVLWIPSGMPLYGPTGTQWNRNLAQNRWEQPCTGCVDCIGKENAPAGPAPAPEPPGHPVEAITHIVEFSPTCIPHRARIVAKQMLSMVPKGALDTPKIALCPGTLQALLLSSEHEAHLAWTVAPEDVREHPGEPASPTDDEDMPTRAFHEKQRRGQQALNRRKK